MHELGGGDLATEIEANSMVEPPAGSGHHDDPFDRMLIAQARLDDLALVTHDPAFERYEVELPPA